ncbi:MAG: SDR family oxidoreductase [Pseudomonadota bacterium]
MLLLGAYGLIGAACARALKGHGIEVVGVGRSAASIRRSRLDIAWIEADIARLSVDAWRKHLDEIDIVVNAAGALQDGSRDSLEAIHVTAVDRLCRALDGKCTRVVQISAAGVSTDAPTAFFRSKARGDAILQASSLDWIILRPTLVIGPAAYGGTALLRGVAGLPGIEAKVFHDRPVQTIGLTDLAEAVVSCAQRVMPMRRVYDLTEPDTRTFGEVVALVRAWLGQPPHRLSVPIPRLVLRLACLHADGLGWLGWRTPLRTTALTTIENGVTGDPSTWRAAGGRDMAPLPDVLASMPATLQDRVFARLYLLCPLAIALLSVFWLSSGLIALARVDAALGVLTMRGFGTDAARAIVIGGAVADIALGALILYRPWARLACLGMAALALAYLAGATLFAPDLWADPLGPLIKVLPSIGLSLIAFSMLEDR